MFNQVISKGKNQGKLFGYSLGFGYCTFRNYSKISSLDKMNVGFYEFQDIGIAYDEVKRQNQLNEIKRSILVEQKYTEADAFEYCIRHNLLSPHYEQNTRDGCAICPNAKISEFKKYIQEYPEAKEVLLYLDQLYDCLYSQQKVKCDNDNKKISPFRDYENFTGRILRAENMGEQLTLF